jgi:hypothetical protein
MLKADISKASRARAGVTGIAVSGFALPVIIGLSLIAVGPAAADAANKQSFTAARAGSATANVVSFSGATTPPAWKARIRPALVGSAAARSGAAPKPGAAAFTAARTQPGSSAVRAAVPPKVASALIPTGKLATAEASRPAEPSKARVAAGPAAIGNDAVLRPIAIAATKNNAALAPAQVSTVAPARATAALAPAAARVPARAAAHTAMLAPSSTAATDRSATRELLRSKSSAIALRKARHIAASHAR